MATILIVDDRASNREFLTTLLSYGGHRLLEAADGAEALAITRAERPDLVIADILMPTMDGYEFVRQLRSDASIARTPVVFCTAYYHEQEARSLAASCGVAHVLTKPCEPETVLKTVELALGMIPASLERQEAFDREHLRLLSNKLSQEAENLRAANARLSALIDLCLELGSERDPRRLLQNFCHRAREIIGASQAIVGVVNDKDPYLRHCFTSGMDAAIAARLGSPEPRFGILGSVMREGRTRRIRAIVNPVESGLPPTFPQARSIVLASIVSLTRTYGWLCLLDKVGADEFSSEDERVAGILSSQVGRIYENGSLYSDVLRHATELEREVAARQRSELALRESEERFRATFEFASVATVLADPNYQFVRINAACDRLLSYSANEMLGMKLMDVAHPDDRREMEACRQKLLNGDENFFQTVVRLLNCSGETIWCLANISLLRDEKAQSRFFIIQLQDITERMQLHDQLREAQRRLQSVIASSPAVLFTLEIAEGRIKGINWVSDNIQQMLGVGPEAACGIDWFSNNLHQNDRQRILEETNKELFQRNRIAHEFRFRHADGGYRWLQSEIRLSRDALGSPAEIVGAWSDVTDRKSLEDQYRQAQKMEAVGRLAGGVAHDFNNLLTIINGYSELVLNQLPSQEPCRDLVREVMAAGNRAAGLTRQLLAFSRRAVIEPRILDLKSLVNDIEKMLRRIIGEDIRLAIAADPEVGAVRADPNQLEQVILNLVVNSRDAMPQGGQLAIEVRNARLDENYAAEHTDARPGEYVLLAVSDTGGGMDENTKAHLFEPFFTTKGELGTGLGLATVHGIIKQSGGYVAVYSELGAGTTFKVYLPRIEQKPSPVSSVQPRTLPRGSELILIVEDEDGVRSLARRILLKCGYTVLDCRDGAEALRLVSRTEGRIQLLITDVVLPRMSGPEIARQVNALKPAMKVLYLSGYTDDAVVRHGILEAEVAFLQKPFSPTALAVKVREVLDG